MNSGAPNNFLQKVLFFTIFHLVSSRSLSRAFSSSLTKASSRVLFCRGRFTTEMSAYISSQCMVSFSEFLASGASIQPHVVLGNEAGDADSIVSALSLAYVDSVFYKALKTPLVSIPRNDLCLRQETVLLLELANVDVDKLHYVDDPDVLKDIQEITLVDHNKLTLATINTNNVHISEIIDHHYDEGSHETVQGDLRNVAFEHNKALVASTCTLVAERLFLSNAAKPPYDSHLSIALLGVILLDTVNMKREAGKGTPRDQAAIDTLVTNTDWSTLKNDTGLIQSDGTIDTNKLFELLSESKFDPAFWIGLTVKDALRLDYKRFQALNGQAFGASSISLNLDSFLSKRNLVKEIESFMKQADVPLLAVLSSQFHNNTPQREMLLCGTDEKLVNEMATYLLTKPKASGMEAKEESLDVAENVSLVLRRLRQGNPKASRKQVAPILLSFYTDAASSSL